MIKSLSLNPGFTTLINNHLLKIKGKWTKILWKNRQTTWRNDSQKENIRKFLLVCVCFYSFTFRSPCIRSLFLYVIWWDLIVPFSKWLFRYPRTSFIKRPYLSPCFETLILYWISDIAELFWSSHSRPLVFVLCRQMPCYLVHRYSQLLQPHCRIWLLML